MLLLLLWLPPLPYALVAVVGVGAYREVGAPEEYVGDIGGRTGDRSGCVVVIVGVGEYG